MTADGFLQGNSSLSIAKLLNFDAFVFRGKDEP
jgi:hypothetical protein